MEYISKKQEQTVNLLKWTKKNEQEGVIKTISDEMNQKVHQLKHIIGTGCNQIA